MNNTKSGQVFPSDLSGVSFVAAVVFVFSFCFDYKGQESGGSLYHYFFATFAFVSGLVAIFALGSRIPQSIWMFISMTALFLMVGVGAAFAYDVPPGQFVRIAIPFFLLWFGLVIGAGIASLVNTLTVERFFQAILVASMLSQLFRLYYSFAIAGMDLGETRYQILSVALPILIAYIFVMFLFEKKFGFLATCSLFMVIAPILLSVTRSFLMTGMAALFASVVVMWKLRSFNSVFSHKRLWNLALVLVLGSVAAGVALKLRPDLLTVWHERLFFQRSTYDEVDITYLTRVAEAEGIWQEVKSGPLSLFFGRGFGAYYSWSSEYAAQLDLVKKDYIVQTQAMWDPPHSIFTHALLIGGLAGVLWVIFLVAMPVVTYLRLNVRGALVVNPIFFRYITLTFIAIILFLSQSLTSNPLGDRMASQLLGICCGYLLTQCVFWRKQQPLQFRTSGQYEPILTEKLL